VYKKELMLVGCGIFKKEINWIIEQNGWEIESHYLPSALHINFSKLATALTYALEKYNHDEKFVFYGACHPCIDEMLEVGNTHRTCGINCVDMLLGHELYMEELKNGAFFFLEDWALNWKTVIVKNFGNKRAIVKDIFQGDCNYILAVRTPTSGDFSKEAEAVSEYVGLPLRTMDVSLDRLQSVLEKAIEHYEKDAPDDV